MRERAHGFSIPWISETRRKTQLVRLLGKLENNSVTIDDCLTIFSLSGLSDWYGGEKKRRLRQRWAQYFGDHYFISDDTAKDRVVSTVASWDIALQAKFVGELYENDPPKGDRGDGNWREGLLTSLLDKSEENGNRNDLLRRMRKQSFIPSQVKEALDGYDW